MKIYIVTAGWDYEGFDIKSVLSCEKEAKIHVSQLEDESNYDNVDYQEWELGDGDVNCERVN